METFSALLAICAGNSPVPGEFPTQRPVRRSFDVYFDLRPNKRLSKQSWGWWFETPSCPLWHRRNVWLCKAEVSFLDYLGISCPLLLNQWWQIPVMHIHMCPRLKRVNQVYICPSAKRVNKVPGWLCEMGVFNKLLFYTNLMCSAINTLRPEKIWWPFCRWCF